MLVFTRGSTALLSMSAIDFYARNVSSCLVRTARLESAVSAPVQCVLQRDLINTLLERLPEEDWYLLLLREIEVYSPAKLSEVTGISETNIRGRLFRARQRR